MKRTLAKSNWPEVEKCIDGYFHSWTYDASGYTASCSSRCGLIVVDLQNEFYEIDTSNYIGPTIAKCQCGKELCAALDQTYDKALNGLCRDCQRKKPESAETYIMSFNSMLKGFYGSKKP